MNIINATDRKIWDHFITSHPEANFLQSWDFYEFHIARGKTVVRRLFIEDNKIVAAYAGVIETARRGRYLAIAGGPIFNWSNQKLQTAIINDIRGQGTLHHCVFARLRPQLESSTRSLALMQKLGLKKSPMYLSVEYAGILDLKKSTDEILKNASQGFRRKLRKAEKNHITITTSTDPKLIKTFYKIQLETASRQKFVAFSENFLKQQFTAFTKNNEAILYIAKLDQKILAMNFMIFYGQEASYHYGVSSELGTKYSAAPLLHLAAMDEAKKRGMTRYNLWGIVGQNDTRHRFYGVSEFKRSFGCEELKYTPTHDLILKPAPYLINKLIEITRRRIRHV